MDGRTVLYWVPSGPFMETHFGLLLKCFNCHAAFRAEFSLTQSIRWRAGSVCTWILAQKFRLRREAPANLRGLSGFLPLRGRFFWLNVRETRSCQHDGPATATKCREVIPSPGTRTYVDLPELTFVRTAANFRIGPGLPVPAARICRRDCCGMRADGAAVAG